MDSFLSTLVNKGVPAESPTKNAQECSTCNGTNVVANASETNADGKRLNENQGGDTEIAQAVNKTGRTTVVMKAPLGELITQAMNEAHKRTILPDTVDVGIENYFVDRETKVAANGQVIESTPASGQAARASLLVGMLPAPTGEVTCLNAALQAMGAVKKVDFVFVNVSNLGDSAAESSVHSKSDTVVLPLESNTLPGQLTENAAIESVEIVVRYKQD